MDVRHSGAGGYLSLYCVIERCACHPKYHEMEKETKVKTIKVAAAIIKSENKIFATQRGYGEFKDGWEFPGGKIEKGETPEEALIREIKEELDALISPGRKIACIEYDYPEFHLSMECFWAEIVSGDLLLKEHKAAKWLSKDELNDVAWLPADLGLIEKVREEMSAW